MTLVGAAYDSAAFAVPFGPAFTKILRTPQSWRRSVVFEQIASFPGRLTVVRAAEDTVVPATIGELLIANARRAEHAEIVDIQNAEPRSWHGLASTAGASRPPRKRHLSRHPGLTQGKFLLWLETILGGKVALLQGFVVAERARGAGLAALLVSALGGRRTFARYRPWSAELKLPPAISLALASRESTVRPYLTNCWILVNSPIPVPERRQS